MALRRRRPLSKVALAAALAGSAALLGYAGFRSVGRGDELFFNVLPPTGAWSTPAAPEHLTGTVLDVHGKPAGDIPIAVYAISSVTDEELARLLEEHRADDTPLTETRTDAQGHFEASVLVGEYDVLARTADRGAAMALGVSADTAVNLQLSQSAIEGSVHSREFVVGDAEVSVVLPRPRVTWTVRTSPAGRFVAGPLPLTDEVIAWSHPDRYAPASTSQPLKEHFELELIRLHRVAGVVTRDDRPAEGAEVVLDGARTTRTDRKGAFLFEAADCFQCVVEARLGNRAGAATGVPAPGSDDISVGIELEPATRIRLHVIDKASGMDVAQAKVTLGDHLPTPRVTAAGGGDYIIEPVIEGSYSMRVTAADHAPEQVDVDIDGTRESRATAALRPGYTIHGVVVSASGDPIPEAKVREDRVEVQTDTHGSFMLDGLSEGDLTLHVEHPAFTATELAVETPEPALQRIELDPATRLDTVVIDPSGQPVPDALVQGVTSDAATLVEYTDENGLAQFNLHADGTVLVSASADGFDRPEPVRLSVRDGDHARATARLARGRMLKALVVDEDGRRVPGHRLRFVPSGTDEGFGSPVPVEAVSTMTGELVLSGLADAFYEVREPGESGLLLQSVRAGDTDARIVVSRRARVRGVVTCDGEPVAQLNVGGQWLRTKNGAFVAEIESKGDTLDLGGNFIPTSVRADMYPGADIDLGEIRVAPLGSISGTILHNGRPVGAVDVMAILLGGNSPLAPLTQRAGTTGAFSLPARLPGSYVVAVNTSQGLMYESCGVASGQDTRVNIDIPDDATILPAPDPHVLDAIHLDSPNE